VPFRAIWELPLAYSDDDLRGAIYANVVNAVMQLQLTLNNNPFVAGGTDNTFAVAEKGTLSYLGNITVQVYQVYLDQLPIGKNGVVLPILDLSTVYEIKNTTFTAITPTQDFPIPYANFRDFLSTFALFNSTGLDTNPGDGSDVSYWALQSANFTNLWKLDPLTAQMISRQIIQTDWPKGLYYFSHRRKPISTTQYGNMELILNALAASASAYVAVGWEDFALVNTLTQAGSLAG
jgi:P3 major capsid protein